MSSLAQALAVIRTALPAWRTRKRGCRSEPTRNDGE
jgi:hypothetical protein